MIAGESGGSHAVREPTYDHSVSHLRRAFLPSLFLLCGLGTATSAHADAVCGGGVTVVRAGTTASCAYTAQGETAFTVPAGVTSLDVVAVGARGTNGTVGDGFGGTPGVGGRGARVTGTLDVTPGQALYVEVGATGESAPDVCISGRRESGPGGANGGGAGGLGRCFGYGGGGGGGASDVRTTPAADGGLTGLAGDPRLLVAGGGGGGGSSLNNPAGNGGDAGAGGLGAGAGGDCGTSAASGGAGGIGAGGGAGGALCTAGDPGEAGASGVPGNGGIGGNGFVANTGGGGGGGGGYTGGGGGATGGDYGVANGGGAGSSFGPADATYATAGFGDAASVTISFEIPPPTVTITAPVDGQVLTVGAAAATAFDCTESAAGPGISSCLDGDGQPSGSPLDTATVGSHTFSVTATSSSGRTATATVSYTVAVAPAAPMAPTVPPVAPATPLPMAPAAPVAPTPLPEVTVFGGGAPSVRASRAGRVVVPEATATCTAGAGPCDDSSVALNATFRGKRVTLGRSVFRLADGERKAQLTVKLSAFGRRVLARKRSLRATAVVTLRNSATAATATEDRGVRLLAPRRR